MQNLKYMYLSYNWKGNITSETNLIEFLKQEFHVNKLYGCQMCSYYFIFKTTIEQLQLKIISLKFLSLLSEFDDDHHVLELALYLGLFLTRPNKCAIVLQTWNVIQYGPKSFSNSEIQKLNVSFGSVTESARCLSVQSYCCKSHSTRLNCMCW